MTTHTTSWRFGSRSGKPAGKRTREARIRAERARQRMDKSAPRTATRRRHAPAIAGALALAMACGVGATETETGTEPEAMTVVKTTPETPLGNDRHVCAYYDAERATYPGTVAVLERADDTGTGTAEGAAYRLLVLTTHEDTPQEAAGELALTAGQALALLGNAQAAQRKGRATREEYRGHAAREGNRLRFTSVDGHGMPRTMIVFTTAGLAIIESTTGRRNTRSDGPYRCARPQPSGHRPLLPTHCAEARRGSVDLESFPAPEAEVTLIQTALDKAGMAPGPIDGILGPRTLGALIRWNEHSEQHRGRIVAYEIICPLIETHSAEHTQ